MSLAARVARRLRSALAGRAAPARRLPGSRERFAAEEIAQIERTYFSAGPARGGPWDTWRDAHLELPPWFRADLDPLGEAYAAQQHRLWRLVAGVERDYDVEADEKEADWGDVDPVRRPGFYVRRDPGAIASASDHVIATGMLLKHCGLQAGDWALEYGAGFAQTALALARLGVNVDTVDVSRTFCGFVQAQADFFGVPLHPHVGRFGDAPRADRRYDLVWFYESFHHCLDFERVVRTLPSLLAPGGRVILAGEPIVERPNAAVPYPWGLRLHSEVAAVVRRQRWFELGFTEDFVFELFAHHGFVVQRIDCEPSEFGRMYVCRHRPAEVDLGAQWMPEATARGWGRRIRGGRAVARRSAWPIERSDLARTLEVDLTNPGWTSRAVDVGTERGTVPVRLAAGGSRTVRVEVPAGASTLVIATGARPGGRDIVATAVRDAPARAG